MFFRPVHSLPGENNRDRGRSKRLRREHGGITEGLFWLNFGAKNSGIIT